MQYRWICGLSLLLLSPAQIVQADSKNSKPLGCAESVVIKVGTYFENMPESGFYAVFQSKLGVEKFPDTTSAVVDRSAGPSSAIAQQRVGDKVRVCLISVPIKDQYCNPDRDSRGRIYQVYNYRLRNTFSGTNANHFCGGA